MLLISIGKISIVTLGPLTNVALAISLDSNFSRKVKRFYVMGSSPLRKGFNVALDPDSSAIFFKTPTVRTKLITSSVLVTKCAIPKVSRYKTLHNKNILFNLYIFFFRAGERTF